MLIAQHMHHRQTHTMKLIVYQASGCLKLLTVTETWTDRSLAKTIYRWDRQTDRHMDKQTGRQTGRQTDKLWMDNMVSPLQVLPPLLLVLHLREVSAGEQQAQGSACHGFQLPVLLLLRHTAGCLKMLPCLLHVAFSSLCESLIIPATHTSVNRSL